MHGRGTQHVLIACMNPCPGGYVLSHRLLDEAYAKMRADCLAAIANEADLTFTADGWSSIDMRSLYLLALLAKGKLYVLDMLDLSDEVHSGAFLAGTCVGPVSNKCETGDCHLLQHKCLPMKCMHSCHVPKIRQLIMLHIDVLQASLRRPSALLVRRRCRPSALTMPAT